MVGAGARPPGTAAKFPRIGMLKLATITNPTTVAATAAKLADTRSLGPWAMVAGIGISRSAHGGLGGGHREIDRLDRRHGPRRRVSVRDPVNAERVEHQLEGVGIGLDAHLVHRPAQTP